MRHGRHARRAGLVALLLATLVVLPAAVAQAHPLGNFTVNLYAGLELAPDRVRVDYVLDMAEIPAFQARQEIDADSDRQVSAAEAARWRAGECALLARGLGVRADGRALALQPLAGRLTFPPGAGGLPTLRLECDLAAAARAAAGGSTLTITDRNFADRIGWREITAAGDGTTLSASDVPAASTSARLTSYPQGLLRSPLDQRSAQVTFRPGGPRLARAGGAAAGRAAAPLGVDRATAVIAALATRHRLGPALALLAVGVALLLGAAHALAPGHGKTVMAAYLVGLRGSLRQALGIGLTVTATHTAGVLALGVALSASHTLAPERLYPWMGLASGLLLAGIGIGLLRLALRTRRQHVAPGHGHAPAGHGHSHAPAGHDHSNAGAPVPGRRGLVAIGFAGGLVPSPSALVVLLGAIALGRAWLGVLLVVAYGAGMAATLTGTGLLLARARGALERRPRGPRWARLAHAGRLLPVASACVVVLVGVVLAARGAGGV